MDSKSSGEGESALNFLLRAKASESNNATNIGRNLDPPLITDYGLTIIDWTKNDIIGINKYVYRLCSHVWSGLSETKESGNSSARSLVKNHPNIIIFDGLNALDVSQFSTYVPDLTILKKIFICKESNQLKLLATISKYLSEQGVFNNDLKLVIVYCDDTYIQDLLDYFVRHKLRFHVILVSYKIPPKYLKGYYNGDIQTLQFLRVDCANNTMMLTKCAPKGKKKTQVTISCSSPAFRKVSETSRD